MNPFFFFVDLNAISNNVVCWDNFIGYKVIKFSPGGQQN